VSNIRSDGQPLNEGIGYSPLLFCRLARSAHGAWDKKEGATARVARRVRHPTAGKGHEGRVKIAVLGAGAMGSCSAGLLAPGGSCKELSDTCRGEVVAGHCAGRQVSDKPSQKETFAARGRPMIRSEAQGLRHIQTASHRVINWQFLGIVADPFSRVRPRWISPCSMSIRGNSGREADLAPATETGHDRHDGFTYTKAPSERAVGMCDIRRPGHPSGSARSRCADLPPCGPSPPRR
jgi:hypothetical protein